MKRHFKTALKTLLASAVLYIVFFTFVWSLIVESVLVGAFYLVHWNTPRQDWPPFRHYIREQPTFRAVCDASNWVADITQPLISDEVMIAHWQKHHKLWEAAIDKKPVNAQPEDYRRYEAYVRSIGLADIGYTPPSAPNPDRFATMIPPPNWVPDPACVPVWARGAAASPIRISPRPRS